MSELRITNFFDEDIIGMNLEALANNLLLDISVVIGDEGSININDINKIIDGRSFEARKSISEAFQWLYNKGYVMYLLTAIDNRQYFITGAGKNKLVNLLP